MKNLLILFLVFSFATSCNAQKNIKDYYYPFTSKIETKVFKFLDKNDSEYVQYWHVTTNPETKEIKTVSYDSEFTIHDTLEEIITENGAELVNYIEYDKNNLGEMIPSLAAEVVEKDVFKWNGDKEYNYSVKYRNQFGRFELSKKRTELGFEKISIAGKEYKALKFKGEYSIKAIEQNDSYSFYQYSFYAKNIGMIKSVRHLPHKIIEMELIETLTESEFKDLLKNAN